MYKIHHLFWYPTAYSGHASQRPQWKAVHNYLEVCFQIGQLLFKIMGYSWKQKGRGSREPSHSTSADPFFYLSSFQTPFARKPAAKRSGLFVITILGIATAKKWSIIKVSK
jgi:hypothetical protein